MPEEVADAAVYLLQQPPHLSVKALDLVPTRECGRTCMEVKWLTHLHSTTKSDCLRSEVERTQRSVKQHSSATASLKATRREIDLEHIQSYAQECQMPVQETETPERLPHTLHLLCPVEAMWVSGSWLIRQPNSATPQELGTQLLKHHCSAIEEAMLAYDHRQLVVASMSLDQTGSRRSEVLSVLIDVVFLQQR